MRKIIHIDMDMYYAAVEIRDNPMLKGLPVIVGGSPNSRGVVSTCSYEARRFGVHSGMSSSHAWKLCPNAVFIYPNFDKYKQASAIIRDIFYSITDLVEPMSLDEAYLDVTENKLGEQYATPLAKLIKQKILEQTHLTSSAGVSYNKFLAKIGSELEKPDGLVIIPPDRAQSILFNLPIDKFHGIGKVTALRMKKLGIHNGKDLFNWNLNDLVKTFGKVGVFYYYVVRGIDNREVSTEHEPKSISCENTFDTDVDDLNVLLSELRKITERLCERMTRKYLQGQSLVLKIKYDNFETITRNLILPYHTNDIDTLYRFAEQVLIKNWDGSRKVRLLGIGLCKLDNDDKGDSLQTVLPFYDEIKGIF